MEESLIAIEIDAFNKMFHQLANKENHICWVRSLDYQRQLYLSPQFETIYESPCSTLYDAPESWYHFLSERDHKDMKVIMPKRIKNPVLHDGENVVYYRITTPQGQMKYIKDWSVLLKDRQDNITAVAGIAEQMPAELWYKEQDEQSHNKPTLTLPSGKSLLEVLEDEKKIHLIEPCIEQNSSALFLTHLHVNGMRVELSKRESQCLEQLCLGYSAKESADRLFISARTVETHLENIRQKTFCKSKIQIMSYVLQQLRETT